jgi:hypothetical protein
MRCPLARYPTPNGSRVDWLAKLALNPWAGLHGGLASHRLSSRRMGCRLLADFVAKVVVAEQPGHPPQKQGLDYCPLLLGAAALTRNWH